MEGSITIARLSDHPEALPTLEQWFEAEWPAWYGPGGRGSARADLLSYASPRGLPRAFVALAGDEVCGVAALKPSSIAGYEHLTPWAAAALVDPSKRRRGIGARLLAELEREARSLGYTHIHCATSTARSLLERCGWEHREDVSIEGESVGVFRKTL